jgi:hypothetical protein
MNPKVLVVVALLVLAGVAGYLLLERDAAGPGPVAPSSGDAPAAAVASTAAAVSAGSGVTGAAAAPAAAPAEDAARTAVPVGTAAGATVTVRGRLVDGKGAPRPGVALALRAWQDIDGIELAELPPPPRARDRAEQPTWTTRADGTFAIPLAKDRNGTLELVAELVFAQNAPTVRGKDGDQDLGDVAALQASSIAGVVHDERGKPVAGVKVSVSLGTLGFGSANAATTGDDGAFVLAKLRAGAWSLRTASGRFLPAVQQVDLGAEERRTGVVVVVRPGNAIAGQVVDDRGVGVGGMKVGSKRKEVRGAVDIERFTPDEATTTDTNGFFTLAGLAEEHATVRAFGPGHSPASTADVAVGTGNLVLRVDRLGAIEGVLVGADGQPIAGSRVRARAPLAEQTVGAPHGEELPFAELDFDGPRGSGATTGADGAFRIESVRPGNVTVVAQGTGHRPARQPNVDVRPAQTTKGVRLVADRGATARVKVVDDAGQPVAGAKVQAGRVPEQGQGVMRFTARAIAVEDEGNGVMVGSGDRLDTATTDADGIALLSGLPAGELQLEGSHAQYAPAVPARATLPKVGTVDATLTLRKPGVAVVTVLGTDGAPQVGVEVQLEAHGDASFASKRANSGDGGVVTFGSLPAGAYTVGLTRAKSPSRVGDAMVFLADGPDTIASSRQSFSVQAGATANVDLRRPVLARLHGVVRGADGPVAGIVVELVEQGSGGAAPLPFGGRNTTSGSNGTFAFDEVESGRYELQFGKPDQVVKASAEVHVPPNTADVEHDLALRTGSVRVQVVARGTTDGVEKAEVELVRADADASAAASSGAAPPRRERRVAMVAMTMTNDGGGADGAEMTTMRMGQQRALTDEDGVAVIDDVPIGEYTVRVKHRRHAPVELKQKLVVERQVTDCGRLELDAAGIVRGKVVGADGKPVRFAVVTCRPVGAPQWGEPEFAQNGSFRVQGLAAGKYVLRAQSPGPGTDGGAPPTGPEVEVDVKAGETASVELRMPGS